MIRPVHMLPVWENVRHVCLPQLNSSPITLSALKVTRVPKKASYLIRSASAFRSSKAPMGTVVQAFRTLGEYRYAGQHQQRPTHARRTEAASSAAPGSFWSYTVPGQVNARAARTRQAPLQLIRG